VTSSLRVHVFLTVGEEVARARALRFLWSQIQGTSMSMWSSVALILTTLVGATVNGALGYGFSSITVPLALLFLTNRALNPAVVVIEVALNAAVLFVNRDSVPFVWRRVMPIVVGLLPGVIVGTMVISMANPSILKLCTFAVLLPLILVQAAGFRRPIQSERSAGFLFGGGLGVLYSVTTISGPPLAVALSNQGVAKRDFRAALAIVRLAESSLTAVAYLSAGMFTTTTFSLVGRILPSIAIGIPLGAHLIRHVRPETFRRVCMSFDAWIVAFGVSTLLRELSIADGVSAYTILAAVAVVDTVLLFRFFAASPAVHDTPRAVDVVAAS
jgi:uncharacterized membrane protein YfcA